MSEELDQGSADGASDFLLGLPDLTPEPDFDSDPIEQTAEAQPAAEEPLAEADAPASFVLPDALQPGIVIH